MLQELVKKLVNTTRHPERFNEDGTLRLVRFWESSKGNHKGTFDEGTHEDKDSRQVRRRKVRVFLFNHISRDPVYGQLPRANRRYWARNTRIPENPHASIQEPSVPVARMD